jgi:ectoine hydroxylase-related dioxygenase (phytanoyl-CoA dioxygenase family)
MEPGSHLWNENETMMTRGGAYFKNSGKKYSVDAVVQSRRRLNMARPNPNIDEFILFSPYLIHGCSDNSNADITRMSVEVRFIQDTECGRKQEAVFNTFLKSRVWR